jgi:hypothetical protein
LKWRGDVHPTKCARLLLVIWSREAKVTDEGKFQTT